MQRQHTIKRDLMILWAFIALIALVLAWLLLQLSRQGAAAQVEQASRQIGLSCQAMSADATRVRVTGVAAAQAVIDLALRDQPGVEGGFWDDGRGVYAYAFPTYDGSGVKRDAPSAELERIVATAQRAANGAALVTDVRPGLRESMVFAACPVAGLAGTAGAPVAWTLKRVPLMSARVLEQLVWSTCLLLGFVVLSGLWLGWTLARWRRQSDGLAARLAQAERMATLGRVAAGLAHEIRNPVGTMRIKAENALAAPAELRPARISGALEAVLEQTARLETLVSSLLALGQPFHVRPQRIDLRDWLRERRQMHEEAAARGGVQIELEIDQASLADGVGAVVLDPLQMGRALDNLLLNALAVCRAGGTIVIGARRLRGDRLGLWIADDGPGVAPALRQRLFDPFVSDRVGGTGLGLALVREIVEAHGGHIVLAGTDAGARFDMELPWHAS
ncbi:PAS domain-containing sensor histidine kinase [Herbaspirillum sp. YR522]|uniref:sensor histidine kinase n=1 Tax=Herbaspirillum sp. YR522 TaxID=1144342 RepID=UPI00026F9192|nr:ATP-binding protein [Herbaspirillum sp. YR522]EJM96309.1 signal transduction histidine kinase [Herbaspirillum sp. YR522]